MIHHVIILKFEEFINNKKFLIMVSLIFAILLNKYIAIKVTNVIKIGDFSNFNIVVFDK